MSALPNRSYLPRVTRLRTTLHHRDEAAQQPLPLVWALPGGVPAAPLTVGASESTATMVVAAPDRLPDPASWAAGLVASTIEVLNGDRPLQQLLRWLDRPVYEQLATAPAAGRRGALRPAVRSVHLCRPRDGVAEAAVLVGSGAGWRAVTVRLEANGHRWRCTHLRLL